ncbi:transmembrane anterior posterior transformation protein 1 homolog [Trichonephila clavipes]|nr:transmembrane anterior posterior transformation protein 1 homolog [Trichonephila clavipes]
MTYVDTSMLYHIVKSQSVIKLYIMFNILEVADKLFSSFGQDILDALYWTATVPRGRKREHFGLLPHLCISLVYVFIHSLIVLIQATTLNVAINSQNKALRTIMLSNNAFADHSDLISPRMGFIPLPFGALV